MKPKTHHGDLARLPKALRPLTDEKHWVNWSWEQRTDANGNMSWTKPPRRSDNLKFARSNDSATWASYDRAVQRWQDHEADGIGFMLADSDIGAIDLDHCCRRNAKRQETTIDDWAQDLRSEANGAYCEVTVSGEGLRLIGTAAGDKVHGNFPIKDARPNARVELFRKAERYITVSGLKLGQCDGLAPIDNVIDALKARFDKGSEQQRIERLTSPVRDYSDLIRHGAPEGQRSESFQAVVWHLATKGWDVDDIVDELARHPNGIGVKYADRLHEEVSRSFEKWQRQNPMHDLPVIKVVGGQIARMVDEAQAALLQAQLPIFVRGGRLVEPIKGLEREAADGRTTKTTVLVPMNDERLIYRLNKGAAKFERYDLRQKDWVATDPPNKVAAMLLALKAWQFPEVIGVVGAPTMRPDGSIISKFGYDAQTRLWCDAEIDLPPIPDKPSRAQATDALRLFEDLLSGFPFASATDKAVALAAVITVVLRGAFDLCPMFMVRAHDVGNGKSYLVDLIATLVTGRYCPVITPGQSKEEMEKRLGAILLEGSSVVSLDNVSFDLESDLLCQILTQPIVKVRILGQSAVPECEWRGTLFGTGNNIRVIGDLVRRALTCNLDAKVERPEQRKFKFDPIARVRQDRGAYIAAAITIARAYDRAGRPAPACRPLGGYSAWAQVVRHPLLWLGVSDPVASMEAARADDPERAAAYELVQRWQIRIGLDKAVTVRDIIAIANTNKELMPVHRYPKFRALLIEHAGTVKGDEIDRTKLGRWLQKQHGRVYGGLRIDVVARKGAANQYKLVEIGEG